MKERKSSKDIYLIIIFLLVFLIVYFFSFIDYTYRIPILMSSVAMLVAIPVVFKDYKIHITTIRIIWGIAICVAFIEMNRCIMSILHEKIYFVVVLLLIFLFKYEYETILQFSFELIYKMGLVFAFFTVFSVLMPDVYRSLIVPLMRVNGNFDIISFADLKGMYSGLTNQASINAIYLCIGLGASFIVLLFSEIKRKRILVILFFITEFICILFTGKRGPLVYASLSMLVVYYFNSKRGKKITNVVKIVFVVAGLLLIAYYFIPAVNMFFTRFFEGSDSGDFSNGRYVLYDAAWNFFQDNKLFGIGWTNFPYSYTRYINVHNVYLQLLCENGILGAIPFYIAFVFTYINTIRTVNRLKLVGGPSYQLVLFSLFLQSFFLMHCLTSNALYDYYISFFYFFGVVINETVKMEHFEA